MSVSPISSTVAGLDSRERNAGVGARPVVGEAPAPKAEPKAAEKPAAPDNAALRDAIKDANRRFTEQSLNLQYSMDEDTKKMVIKLVDANSGEVIRQIPGEEMLAIARELDRALTSGVGFAIQTEA